MSKKLSVIIPVYNVENYLEKCIDSVLAQIYSDIEIILVDDGSTDRSGAICDKYADEYENVIVIHKSNEGVIKARLDGLMKASSEYVTFVDADDWIDKNMYMDMMHHIDDSDMVMSQIYRYYDDDNIVAEGIIYEDGKYDKADIKEKIIPHILHCKEINRWAIDPSLCTKIFRKELFLLEMKRVSELDVWYGDDTAMVFPYLTRANSIYILSKPYYYHRQRQKGQVPYYIKDDLFFGKLYKVYDYLDARFKETDYYEELKPQLDHFYIMSANLKSKVYGEVEDELAVVFPYEDVHKDSKVIIYGAGRVGKEYVKQNELYNFCNIIKWVDKRYQYIKFENYKIDTPDDIAKDNFDYIVIAIDIYEAAVKVKKMLLDMGVAEEKIVWHSMRKKRF